MIDSTLFIADVPAGTYALGDTVPMVVKYGPANVRSGYGEAKLKQVVSGYILNPGQGAFEVVIQNSNLIDPIINSPNTLSSVVGLDPLCTGIQSGHDCRMEPNSTWTVYAKCIAAGTTTTATSIFALIDIDYPSVGSVANPLAEQGIPTSIELGADIPFIGVGSAESGAWTTVSTDFFKPGYKYLLEKVGSTRNHTTTQTPGFIALANAAAQQGLSRIIPMASSAAAVAHAVSYAEALTKGPMDVKFFYFSNLTSGSTSEHMTVVFDFVKRPQ